MVFGNGVKNIQDAAYDEVHTVFKIIDQFHKFLTWNLWYSNLKNLWYSNVKWKLEHIITLSKIILKKTMWGDGRHLCDGKPLFAFLWVYS